MSTKYLYKLLIRLK